MNGQQGKEGRMQTRMAYRQWVEEGARGSFLTPSVAVTAVRLINPLDRGGGYFVRRDTSDPTQRELRARIKVADQEDGERDDLNGKPSREQRREARHRHRHVLAYDSEPPLTRGYADGTESQGEPWVVTARVERASEVVRRGWLGWETLGDVVAPARVERAAQ